MFNRTAWYQTLKENLRESAAVASALDGKTIAALFQVELGLFLLTHLGMRDEPIAVLPTVLSGIPFPALSSLNTEQQSSIAIGRLLLSAFSSETGWEEALKIYAPLPDELCIYHIRSDMPFNEQLVVGCLRPQYQGGSRHQVYEQTLSTLPIWANFRRDYPKEGELSFSIITYGKTGRHERSAQLVKQHIEAAGALKMLPFRDARDYIEVPHNELEQVAQYMDERLAEQGLEAAWVKRLRRYVHYHAYDKGRLTKQANTTPLKISGFTHLVGMVGSGKSTLMKIIAVHGALQNPSRKTAIVLSDVTSVLDAVDELNRALGADPDHPIAVPLIGRSNRHEHLKRLYARQGTPSESGERALNTACPLFGLLPDDQLTTLPGIPEPGREPCEQLKRQGGERTYLCPLFHQCPSQQVWHDLPTASIIVTTAGAMAKSSVPSQIDSRRLKYGEYLYTHCDLVIFDECDTAMEWFDSEFATVLDLWGRDSALFNRADPAASTALTSGLNRNEARWVRAERRSAEAIENLIDQLSNSEGAKALRRWVGERYFTAFHLFRRIAMRAVGLWDFTEEDQIPIEKTVLLEEMMKWFSVLLDGDPMVARRRDGQSEAVHQLVDMLRQILDVGSASVLMDCEVWLEEHLPNLAENLEDLNIIMYAKNKQFPPENVKTLAQKLTLALNAALLDRNLRTVFYEWYNQPDSVDDEIGGQPFRPPTATLSDVLPVPAIGRIFGTYYIQEKEDENDGLLSRFEYSNIGRIYLLHYHKLLADLGIYGPNVLALSGTSWLEGSSQWHVPVPPVGVLQATLEERDRIRDKSNFAFIPQRDAQGKAIQVSGSDDMLAAIRQLTVVLTKSGQLDRELGDLKQLGIDHPKIWEDRERILLLVNSYAQAKAVAHQIVAQTGSRTDVIYLTRPGEQTNELYGFAHALQRGDIEQVAFKDGKILVAPIGSIGRAYNILNREKLHAAFGALYFLVRPMPHPYDVQGLASEMNAYSLEACSNPHYPAWSYSRLYDQSRVFRHAARDYWQRAEMRYGYSSLKLVERRDLAATTFGRIVQAAGRLVRGGVPFHCYFVDASWAPKSADAPNDTPRDARLDSAKDSLLTEIIALFERYDSSVIGKCLYEPFSGLLEIDGFYPDRKSE